MESKYGEKTVLDPFGTSFVADYERLYKEFGIEPFQPLLSKVPNPSVYMRRGIVFGHRDFERVLDVMVKGEKFAVLSGIKPTGEFHLGTLMTVREIIYFQQRGAQTFYCIADIEAYEDNKIPFERSEKIAVDNVADLLALGFDPKKGYIYRQSKESRIKDLAIIFGRAVTLATMKAIYGERHIGLYLAALIQAGDILLPQLEEFGGPKPTVIPVGVDQDPHIRFTRDLAQIFQKKYGFILPSSTYHKLMKGLDGSPKMSKRLMNYFTLHDKPEVIAERISNAFTGGRATIKEQRKLGGVPEICPVYEICLFHFVEDDDEIIKTYHDCKTGKLLCGEHKKQTIDIVLKFVKEHKRRKRKFVNKALEILQLK
ncbi:MAG: tryptophan--tRNA ligase [Candidatus Bathyarchaeia archaeon]